MTDPPELRPCVRLVHVEDVMGLQQSRSARQIPFTPQERRFGVLDVEATAASTAGLSKVGARTRELSKSDPLLTAPERRIGRVTIEGIIEEGCCFGEGADRGDGGVLGNANAVAMVAPCAPGRTEGR